MAYQANIQTRYKIHFYMVMSYFETRINAELRLNCAASPLERGQGGV